MYVLTPAPSAHIGSCLEAGDFHGNKVLMKKIESETLWLKSVKKFLVEIQTYAAAEIKMGITWNPRGKSVEEESSSTSETTKGPPSGKGQKGPPPPLISASKGSSSNTTVSKGKGKAPIAVSTMADVLGEMASNPTAKLRKVQDSEKTKNRAPEDKVVKTFQPSNRSNAVSALVKKKGEVRGEPKKQIVRDNWMVENYSSGLVELNEVNMGQILYITNSNNTAFRVGGKIKSVCLDNCSKVNLEVQDVLSSVEIVNSEKVNVHCVGKVNTIQVKKNSCF